MKTVASTTLTFATNSATRLGHRLAWTLIQTHAWVQAPSFARQRRQRGLATVELILLIAGMAIPVAFAFVSLGMPLLRYFRYAQMALVSPLP